MKKIFTLFAAAIMTLAMSAEAISEYPYTNGFDSETSEVVPAGWTKVAGTDYYPSVDTKTNISTRNSSAKALVFQGYNSNGEQILALPEFSLDAKYLKLEFYYKTKSSSYPAQFSIGYVTDLTNKASYVKLQDLSYSADGFTKATQSFESAPDGAYLAIYFKGTGASNKKAAMYVDDVTVSSEAPASSCAEVGAPVASDVTAHGATLTWAAATEVTNYQFVCLEKGAELDWTGVEPKAQLTVSYNELKSNTEYTFYVRSYCGAGEGEQGLVRKVAFTTELACYAPDTLILSNITAEGLTLTWTASGHGETQYQYAVALAGQTPETWTLVEGLTANVSGLQASSNYVAYVRSYCSELDQSDALSEAFKTPCGVVAAPWSENFNSYSSDVIPECWDNAASTSETAAGSSAYYVWGVYERDGVTVMRLNNSMTKAGTALINTPSIALPAKAQELTFEYSHRADCGNFVLKISTDNGVSFSDLASYEATASATTWDMGTFTPANVNLKPYAGDTVILQFFANANYENGAIFIDNIDIHDAPSCFKPTDLKVSNIAANTATLAWTSDASAWKYQLSEDGENWSEAQAAATNPFELSALKANTLYYVRVQANCGEGDLSEWSEAVSFRTDCGALSIPYNEGFEGTDANKVPNCWARISSNEYPAVIVDGFYETYAYEGSKCLKFYGYAVDQIAVLPELESALNKVVLSFWYNATDDDDVPVPTVGYITNLADAASYVAVDTLALSDSYVQAKVNFESAPAGARIAIRYQGGEYNGSLYVDNVAITDASATAITNTAATKAAIKRIENGQVVIIKNGIRFNVLGTILE